MKTETPAERALGTATVSLVVASLCTAMFVPPFLEQTTASLLRIIVFGIAIGVGLVLHWAYVGIAARRLGRSAFGWVTLAVLSCPVGGIAALLLLRPPRGAMATKAS